MRKCLIYFFFHVSALHAYEISSLNLVKDIKLNIPEASSLSFSIDQQSLLTVSDQNGSAYSLSFNGEVLGQYQTGSKDLEGIVAHDDINGACTVDERIRELKCYDKSWKLTKSKLIPFNGVANSGFEGIAYNPSNRHFYIVNEKSPKAIIELDDDFDVIKVSAFEEALDLSDIFFNHTDQKFWIVSHESKMIYQTDLNFNVLSKYRIPDVKQAEGIVVDSDKKRIYIVSDKDSRLYIYEY